MRSNTRTLIRTLDTAADKTGVQLPADLKTARDRADAADDAAAAIADPGDALPRAVMAAQSAGKDPATDKEVQRLLAQLQLATNHIAGRVSAVASDDLHDAILAAVPELLEGWQAALGEAVDAMAAHVDVLGDLDLNNPAAILRSGTEAAEAWHAVEAAQRRIQAIIEGWKGLFHQVANLVVDRRWPLLVILPPEQAEQLPTDASIWDVVKAGHRPALLDAEGYRARTVDRQAGIQANATAAAQQRDHNATQRFYGTGVGVQ